MLKLSKKAKIRLLKTLALICALTIIFGLAYILNHRKPTKNNQATNQLIDHLNQENKKLKTQLSACKEQNLKYEHAYPKQVKIESTDQGGYFLTINGQAFFAMGVGYNPTPVGKGYDYDFFSDPNKPWLIDGKLMKEAGINCVRIYSTGKDLDKVKEFIRDMYEKFGIYTIVSDWLGLWDFPRANYASEEFKKTTQSRVLNIVSALKNEPGVLMWVLGNENNYTFSGRIGFWTSQEIESLESPCEKQIERAKIYYSFINQLSKEIKKIDMAHPVALGNGEANYLEVAPQFCPDIDILAIIIYRGKTFGNLFNNIHNSFDKPILLSEFGCESYDAYKEEENQDVQAEFIIAQWQEIYENSIFSKNNKANVVGGVVFEWNDEWWKHDEGFEEGWSTHNKEAGWSQGAYYFDIKAKDNLNMNEEWFGIVSLGEEEEGINKRIPKKSYYVLSEYFRNLDTDLSR
jgi:beta-galactosidase